MIRSVLALALLAGLSGTAFAAGDVQVTVERGKLRAVGDEAANDVQIDKNSVEGFVIVGRNGTTINGSERVVLGKVKSMRIDMGAGDDVLAMGGFGLDRSLRVVLGDGDDRVSLLRATIRGRATLLGGSGDDEVVAEGGTRFMRGVRVGTDAGLDLVRIADSEVHGRLKVFTGDDADRVELHRDGFTELASLSIRTGAGDDVFDVIGCTFQAHVKLLTADGEDTVYVATSRFRKPVLMKTGHLDDEIEFERSTFDSTLKVNGGTGANAVLYVGVNISGGSSSSSKYSWRFVIVHFFP